MEASDQQAQDERDEGTDPAARTEEQEADAPEPTQGDQGPQVIEQDAAAVEPHGFDPDRPVRTSPPTADQQSGVPGLPENADVQAGADDREESVTAESEGGSAGGDQGEEPVGA